MLKNYIKIAWKVLLRRKFFTFVSLFGISFTLLVLMVVAALVDHVSSPAAAGSKFDRCLHIMRIHLKGEKIEVASYPSYYFLDRYVRTMKRPEAVSIHSRLKNFREIYPSFNTEEIASEAERCFSCGLCYNCGNCYMYCPDNAVKISPSTGKYEFDLDFCKGCGLCAKECPCRYIQLTLEK